MKNLKQQWENIKAKHNEYVILITNDNKNYYTFNEDAQFMNNVAQTNNTDKNQFHTNQNISDVLRLIIKNGKKAALCEPQPQPKKKITIDKRSFPK